MLFLYGLIRYGSISPAFTAMKKNDIKRAKVLLDETYRVEWLSKPFKGYYYMISGYVKTVENDLERAILDYHNALKYGVRTKNNESLIYYQLAILYVLTNRLDEAPQWLEKVKSLEVSPELMESILKIEKVFEKPKEEQVGLLMACLNNNPQ
jgi:tetratricopeptide (TPR) repeat protein